ncbi:unnamed protein product [Moneuplotes crassus]|uniref:Uncharacterized protein n=1 Tax=Euplotes crassus TaxID=5936 RepID=A0AAD1Y9C2_EUPCR|nr:unnamed protein product [Moneuplotes crassus]
MDKKIVKSFSHQSIRTQRPATTPTPAPFPSSKTTEEDLLDWKLKSLKKEKEFLLHLKLTREMFQELDNEAAMTKRDKLIGNTKSKDEQEEYQTIIDQLLQPSKARKNFVRFSHCHQGFLEYLIQKSKIEKVKKEQEEIQQNKKIFKVLSKKPIQRTKSGGLIIEEDKSESEKSSNRLMDPIGHIKEYKTALDCKQSMLPDYNDNIVEYFDLDHTGDPSRGITSADNTKRADKLSLENTRKVNKFIKKINFEKFHIHYSPEMPDWEKEMILTKINTSNKNQRKTHRRMSVFTRMDDIIKEAREIGKKKEERPESPKGSFPFSFGKRANSKKKHSTMNKINLQVSQRLRRSRRGLKIKSARKLMPGFASKSKMTENPKKSDKKKCRTNSMDFFPSYILSDKLIKKDRMLRRINCDFKESLVVPFSYILKNKKKNSSMTQRNDKESCIHLKQIEEVPSEAHSLSSEQCHFDSNPTSSEAIRISPKVINTPDSNKRKFTISSVRSKDSRSSVLKSTAVDFEQDASTVDRIIKDCNKIFIRDKEFTKLHEIVFRKTKKAKPHKKKKQQRRANK